MCQLQANQRRPGFTTCLIKYPELPNGIAHTCNSPHLMDIVLSDWSKNVDKGHNLLYHYER